MMRSKYSRAGFSFVALYLVMSTVSGIAVGLFFVGKLFMDLPSLFLSLGKMSLDEVLWLFRSEAYADLVLLGSTVGAAIGMIAGLAVMRAILGKREFPAIERRDLSAKEFLLILMVTFGFWGIGALIGNLPDFFGVLSLNLSAKDPTINLIFIFYAILIAPVLEELAFRKLFLDRVHPYGELLSALASALLFALFHGNAAQFPLAFGTGFMLALVYLKTGQIAYCMLIHCLINLTGTLPELFGLFGVNVLIPWYVLVAVLMVGGLVLWWVNRKEEVLTLKRSVLEDANRQAFRNPGMLIAIIGGLVVTGITETSLLISALMPDASGNSNLAAFVRLVPIAVVVITVAWVLAKSWERTDPKWPALPGENDSSGNPGV